MALSRRVLLATLPLAGLAAGLTAKAAASPRRTLVIAPPPTATPTPTGTGTRTGTAPPTSTRSRWTSGVTADNPVAFGLWRRSPVQIAGMFADASVAAQAQQWQFTHSTFDKDIDLAVGGPIDRTWAQAATGSEVHRWTQMARILRENWRHRTVYLRYAHEANGDWMPWS